MVFYYLLFFWAELSIKKDLYETLVLFEERQSLGPYTPRKRGLTPLKNSLPPNILDRPQLMSFFSQPGGLLPL